MNITLRVVLYTLRTIVISFYVFWFAILAIGTYSSMVHPDGKGSIREERTAISFNSFRNNPAELLVLPITLFPVVGITAAFRYPSIAIIEIVALFCVGYTFYKIQKDKKLEKVLFQRSARYILVNIALIIFFIAMIYFASAIARLEGF